MCVCVCVCVCVLYVVCVHVTLMCGGGYVVVCHTFHALGVTCVHVGPIGTH